jgi:hypothetical protein
VSDKGFKNGRKVRTKQVKTASGGVKTVLDGSTPERVDPIVPASSPSTSPVITKPKKSETEDKLEVITKRYKDIEKKSETSVRQSVSVLLNNSINLETYRAMIEAEVIRFDSLSPSDLPNRIPSQEELEKYVESNLGSRVNMALVFAKDPNAYKLIYLEAFGTQVDYEAGLSRTSPGIHRVATTAPMFFLSPEQQKTVKLARYETEKHFVDLFYDIDLSDRPKRTLTPKEVIDLTNKFQSYSAVRESAKDYHREASNMLFAAIYSDTRSEILGDAVNLSPLEKVKAVAPSFFKEVSP